MSKVPRASKESGYRWRRYRGSIGNIKYWRGSQAQNKPRSAPALVPTKRRTTNNRNFLSPQRPEWGLHRKAGGQLFHSVNELQEIGYRSPLISANFARHFPLRRRGTEGDFRSSPRRNRCKSPSIPLLQRGKCPAMSSSRSNIKNFNKFLN